MTDRLRLQKALSGAGLMSRRAAEEAILAGRVTVDGRPAVLGDRVDPSHQVLAVDGIPVNLDPEVETWLLYKPVGVVSSASDTHGRPTVVDLIDTVRRVYPVGRLDLDSEGLILVSNDGDLTNRVTHPRYGITKTYVAKVNGQVTPSDIQALLAGVDLEDGPARALQARIVDSRGGETLIELVMGEGRNREVRRMMETLGHEVVRLVRTAIGPLADRSLKPGEARLVTLEEIRALLGSGATTE